MSSVICVGGLLVILPRSLVSVFGNNWKSVFTPGFDEVVTVICVFIVIYLVLTCFFHSLKSRRWVVILGEDIAQP